MLQYLLKFSISLAVLFVFYLAVLRPLTFYTWNRFYLLCYSLCSFIIPFIDITPWVAKKGVDSSALVSIIPSLGNYALYANSNIVQSVSHEHPVTASQWLLILFCTGVLVMLFRFVMQYRSLRRIRRQSVLLNQNDDVQLFQTAARVSPFSFGNAIYFNNSLHSAEELHKIIQHEFVHVKQKHSVDMLVGELLCIINWFNPFAWFIRRAIRQNLEFIADNAVIENGLDKKEYQYLLLKVIGIPQYSIGNHFNFSNLKKRIRMMNKIKSAKLHLTKFLFVLPLLTVLLLAFRNTVKDRQGKFVFAGIVYDAKTLTPLANVSIHEKYSRVTALTDGNGFFKIKMGLTPKPVFKISCAYTINGYDTAGYNDLSFAAERDKNYAEISFVSMRRQNNPAYNDVTTEKHYQLPVDKNNELVPDPDYNFVKSKFDEVQFGKNLSDRIDKLVKDSRKPIWIIDGIPYAIGNGERAWFDKKEVENSPAFKVWVDGKLMSMDEANAMVNRLEIKGLSTYAAEEARKKFGINENVLVLYWKTTPLHPAMARDTMPLPPPPPPAKAMSDVINKKGFIISIADNSGEAVVLVRDKSNKIIKAVPLTEWNNHKNEYEDKYGKLVVPPPPPPASLVEKIATVPPVALHGSKDTIPHPLVIIDGVIKPDIAGVNRVNPDDILSINVLKDKDATNKYGDKGKNGVVEITTVNPGAVTDSAKPRNLDLYKLMAAETSGKNPMAEALVVIDGREMPPGFNPNEIKPAAISIMNVLQGAEATIKYGDKASKGAIELLLKNFVGIALLVVDGVAAPDGSKWEDFMYLKSNYELKNVLRGKDATDRYGDKGKNGVIEIKTKKRNNAGKNSLSSVSPFFPAVPIRKKEIGIQPWHQNSYNSPENKVTKEDLEEGIMTADTIIMKKQHLLIKGGSVSVKGKEIVAEGELSFRGMDQWPFVIYNGKEITDLNSFKVAKARYSLLSLDEKQGLARYGTKAKYGAIEINRL